MRRGLRGIHAAERRGSGEAASLMAQYGHLAVTDPERADPALPAGDVADERAELDELRLREMAVQLLPQLVARERRVPADRIRVTQRDPLAVAEEVRRLVALERAQLLLGDQLRLLSRPDSPLIPSVLAFERLRDTQAAQLFDRQIDDAVSEEGVPRRQEGAQDLRLPGADRLDLGARRAVQHRALQLGTEVVVLDLGRVCIPNARHARKLATA